MVERAEHFYTPSRVRKIVNEWAHYVALEEDGQAARGLLTQGPTPETPSAGTRQKGYVGDPMRGVPIVADILRAWKALGSETIEYKAISWKLFLYSDDSVPRPQGDIRSVLEKACELMAITLGWEPEPETLHPFQTVRACEQCGEPMVTRTDAKYCGPTCRLKAWRLSAATAT